MKKLLSTSIKGIKQTHTNTYVLDFTRDKKRYRKTLSVSTLEEAQSALNDFRKELDFQDTIEVNIASTVNDYWETMKVVKRWSTLHENKMEAYYIKNIKNVLGDMKITEVKPKHFTFLNNTLKHLSSRSQKKAYEILQPLFNLAIEDELIVLTPIKKTHVPVRKQLEEKKIIINAEVKLRYIYQAIHTYFGTNQTIKINNHPTIKEVSCKDNPHHLALFLFGFHGRRLNEVTSLKWNDINFINRSYIVRASSSKVNLDMTFQLTEDIKNVLDRVEISSGHVFHVKQVQRHYEKIRAISGIPDFTFHWLRNLLVSALASKGTDTTHLSAMLGHTDTSTLKKYLSLQRETSTAITSQVTSNLLGLNQDFTDADYWEEEE